MDVHGRDLRYFVAVAEAGSLTVAAEQRLHTAQPSLSRQIRDLEYEVGVPLLVRSVHGVELTDSGKAFIEEIYARHEKDLECVASGLTYAERRTLYEGLKKIGLAAKVAIPTQKCPMLDTKVSA